ncbi:MAG: Spy/CpxP family protein refolding chaperone [Burkholderiaceae bacterium]
MTLKTRLTLSPAARLMAAGWIVALAGTAATLAQAQPMGPRHGGPMGGMMAGPMGGPMAGPMGGPFGSPMSDRLLDSVGASADQKTRIRDIMRKAADDQRAQRDAGMALRDQAMALFTQPTVDAAAAESLRQKMLAQHDQSSRRWMQAALDAAAVLTPEQRTKLADRMKQRRDMMERHQRERRALDTPKS